MEQSEIDKWINRYPDMTYNEYTNTFSYRNIKLTPFVAGIKLGIPTTETCDKCGNVQVKHIEGGGCSYLLQHKERPWIWLFNYGTPEEMWSKFTKMVKQEESPCKHRKVSFWESIFG